MSKLEQTASEQAMSNARWVPCPVPGCEAMLRVRLEDAPLYLGPCRCGAGKVAVLPDADGRLVAGRIVPFRPLRKGDTVLVAHTYTTVSYQTRAWYTLERVGRGGMRPRDERGSPITDIIGIVENVTQEVPGDEPGATVAGN